MTDPYAPSAVIQQNNVDDENEAFINQSQPNYVVSNSSNAYDDNENDVHQALKQAYQYSSAPDPTLSSATAGDWNQFKNTQMQIQNPDNNNNNDTLIIKASDPLNLEDEGYGHSTYGQRMDYTYAVYRDKFFLLLWIIHFLIMISILIYEWSDTRIVIGEANAGFLIVFICAVIGAILGYIWTQIIRKYSGRIIKLMLWGNLIFLLLASFINFIFMNLINCVIFMVFAFIFGIYMWSIWKRIPFTEILIEISSSILNIYQSTVIVALGILILQIIWICIWSAIVVAYMSPSHSNFSEFTVFLLLISFYWNLEVFKNIGHTTYCGVAATWYFTTYPVAPTSKSLRRALTTSLGSIAFGSLIVAIIHVMRKIVDGMLKKTKHNVVRCLLDCLLRCLERAIQYFNMYAFVFVAIYGESYIKSSKMTWDLLHKKGIFALINDDLTGFVILCGSLIGGVICAIVGGIMSYGTDAPETYAFFGFLVGFYLCLTVLQVVTSCVMTIFVCYAEDPHTMSVNHPAEFMKIENARNTLGHVIIADEDQDLEPSI